jgi:hypothetical protein
MTNDIYQEKISTIFGRLPPKPLHISGGIVRSEGDFAAGKAVGLSCACLQNSQTIQPCICRKTEQLSHRRSALAVR